mgnify:FL=1
MSMTESRMVRRLVSNVDEARAALNDMNFPRMPIEVLSYPLARQPWGSQKFQRTVSTEEDLSKAVSKAISVSEIGKALLIGWPIYK